MFRLLLRLPLLCVRACSLGVLQALLGPRGWVCAQLGVVAVPLSLTRSLRLPLLTTWGYGLLARLIAHAHWRSLQFWKRVLPIYAGYKWTQLGCIRAGPKVRERRWAARHAWGAERVYALCVSLRGFYLKDGQFLGARTDFVPAAWCGRLRALQDRVPPAPFRAVEQTLRDSFSVNTVGQLFRDICRVPIASATIAQVHRATTREGVDVALKAQYIDQERLCTLDLLNLKRLATFLQRFDMDWFDMQAVVREFEQQIPTEFDFIREAVHMTMVRENLEAARIEGVVVPRAIPGLVSRMCLAMEYIEGSRVDNHIALKLWGINPESVVLALGRAYGQMLLVDGLAHCDPHFGNILVRPDGRVALIDFGQTKEVPESLRRRLCAFYLALCSGNRLALMKTFGDLGIELSVPWRDMDESILEMVPIYANGLLDTAPLPAGIDIDPFSEQSPLKKLPIKKFNQDLFMVLRTMGLLRVLCETHAIATPMSQVFRPYAVQGLWRTQPCENAKRRRREDVRAVLTSSVASPFVSEKSKYGLGYCALS